MFVGVNSNDNDGDARDFLADNPVPYDHFEDPKLEVAASFNGVQAFPTTAFYDSKGELAFVHQGGYPSEDAAGGGHRPLRSLTSGRKARTERLRDRRRAGAARARVQR